MFLYNKLKYKYKGFKMVLMLDDDVTVLKNIEVRLEIEDIELTRFDNPEKFIKFIESEEFDISKYKLFICDYKMLPMNGVQVISKLKDLNLPDTVLFTGNANQIKKEERLLLEDLGVKIISKASNNLYDIIEEKFDI